MPVGTTTVLYTSWETALTLKEGVLRIKSGAPFKRVGGNTGNGGSSVVSPRVTHFKYPI